jgi:hypothetical protein
MVPSRELEMLRVQMTEELELPHRQRVDALNVEITRYRDQYLGCHRELELLRTCHQQAEHEHKLALADATTKQAATVRELREKNDRLQTMVEDTSVANALRGSERTNADMMLRLKAMAGEVDDLRSEKEDAVVAREESYLSHVNAVKLEQGKLMLMEKQLAAAQRRNELLDSDAKETKYSLAALQERVLELEQAKRDLTNRAEAAERDKVGHAARIEKRMEAAATTHNDALNRGAEQLKHTQTLLEEANKQLTGLTEASRAAERDAATKLAQQHEVDLAALNTAELATRDANAALTELHARASDDQREAQALADAQKVEIGTLRATSRGMETERERLMQTAEEKTSSNDELMRDFQARLHELQELTTEYEALQAAHRALLEKERDSRAAAATAARELQLARGEVDHVTRELMDERTGNLITLQKYDEGSRQDQIASERDAIRSREESERLLSVANAKVQTLEAAKNKYKRLANTLKTQLTILSRQFSDGRTVSHEREKTRKAQLNHSQVLLRGKESEAAELKATVQSLLTSPRRGGGGGFGAPLSPVRGSGSQRPYSARSDVSSVFSQSFVEEQQRTQTRLSELQRSLADVGGDDQNDAAGANE